MRPQGAWQGQDLDKEGGKSAGCGQAANSEPPRAYARSGALGLHGGHVQPGSSLVPSAAQDLRVQPGPGCPQVPQRPQSGPGREHWGGQAGSRPWLCSGEPGSWAMTPQHRGLLTVPWGALVPRWVGAVAVRTEWADVCHVAGPGTEQMLNNPQPVSPPPATGLESCQPGTTLLVGVSPSGGVTTAGRGVGAPALGRREGRAECREWSEAASTRRESLAGEP